MLLVLLTLALLVSTILIIKKDKNNPFWIITSILTLLFAASNSAYLVDSKDFITKYEIISHMVDCGISDSEITKEVININKAITTQKERTSSLWCNWQSSKKIASLKLLEYESN